MTDNAVNELNRILAEGLAKTEEAYYECILCDRTFDIGRKARQHALDEHGSMKGYRRRTVGG